MYPQTHFTFLTVFIFQGMAHSKSRKQCVYPRSSVGNKGETEWEMQSWHINSPMITVFTPG